MTEFAPHEIASYVNGALLVYIILRWLPAVSEQLRLIRENHVSRKEHIELLQRLDRVDTILSLHYGTKRNSGPHTPRSD